MNIDLIIDLLSVSLFFLACVAHVLPGERIRKPDGRISCEDEGWVTLHTYFATSFSRSSSHFFVDVSGLAGFARLCAGDQYEVRRSHDGQTQSNRWFLLAVASCCGLFWGLVGPDAVRPAALEAARSCGGQQQADMGQRGVHFPASGHGTPVYQGN